jgi:hypothetical protein
MKVIRTILNGNKKLFAFWLVLFFLFAGLTRSFAAAKTTSGIYKKEQTSGSNFIAETDENSYDDLKIFDLDSDDFEFVLFSDCNTAKFFISVKNNATPLCLVTGKNIYTLPLYDLFCNWKLHLS